MNPLKIALREVIGLFIDDGSLALEVVAVVMSAAIAQAEIPKLPLVSGGVLLFGCLGILFMNVWRSSVAESRPS